VSLSVLLAFFGSVTHHRQSRHATECAIASHQAEPPRPRGASDPGIIFADAHPRMGQFALDAAGLPGDLGREHEHPYPAEQPLEFRVVAKTLRYFSPCDDGCPQHLCSMRRNEPVRGSGLTVRAFEQQVNPERRVRQHAFSLRFRTRSRAARSITGPSRFTRCFSRSPKVRMGRGTKRRITWLRLSRLPRLCA